MSRTLTEAQPELAHEWHPAKNGDLTPSTVAAGSHKKAWWVGPCGHEWEAEIKSRVFGGRACPFCASRAVLPGFNDLGTTQPALAAEVSPRNEVAADRIAPYSSVKHLWLGACGHEWRARASSRQAGAGCPRCSGRLVIPGVTDIETTHPQLAAEWDHKKNGKLSPRDLSAGSRRPISWRCQFGHGWEATPAHRRVTGCPYCSGRRAVAGQTDLATTNSDLAAEWHPKNSLDPTAVSAGSERLTWWIGQECAHEWEATINSRKAGNGCPFCGNKAVLPGFNDLGTTHPAIAVEWHPEMNGALTPQAITAGSDAKVWWKCSSNPAHVWAAVAGDRKAGTGCPLCWKGVSTAEDELAEILAALVPGVEVIRNDRKLLGNRREVDFHIPGKRLAIEFNGLFWHSESHGKDRGYHAEKAAGVRAAGSELFTIWGDHWNEKAGSGHKALILRELAERLGATDRLHLVVPYLPAAAIRKVDARKLVPATLSRQEAVMFLNANHLHGPVTRTINMGLKDGQGVVKACLSVRPRRSAPGTFEIVRYATKGTVKGGLDQLLEFATQVLASKGYPLKCWEALADLAIWDGDVYEQIGFTKGATTLPDYSYLARGRRVSRFEYLPSRFREAPELTFKEGMTGRQLADLNGLHRIWDHGRVRYVKNI